MNDTDGVCFRVTQDASMKNKIIDKKAYLGTFGASLFIQLCTVLQAILLARMLGPVGRGEFATIILWPNFFAGIGILGVNMAIARFAGQGVTAGVLLRVAVKATVVTGTMTALLCGIFLPTLLPVDKQSLLPVVYLYLLSIPLNHLSWNMQSIDHGAGNFKWLNLGRITIHPIYFIGLILCWHLAENKVFWVTVALLIGIGSSIFFRMMAYGSKLFNANPGPRLKDIFKNGLPFSAASILMILYSQMDKALVVWMLSSEEIGWYVAAFAAAGGINILNSTLGTIQFTASAQAENGYGFAKLAGVLRKGAVLGFLGGGLLVVLLPWLLPLVYGPAFQNAIPIAIILLPGLVLSGWGGIIDQALRGQGRPIAGVVSKLLGLIVMGIVGVELGHVFGGKGVACGYVAGEIVATAGIFIVSLRIYKDSDLNMLRPDWNDIAFVFRLITKYLNRGRIA